MSARRVFVLGMLFTLSAAAFAAPPDVTAEATGPDGAVVTYTSPGGGGGDDENGRPIDTVSCAPAPGSKFPLGTTTVSCADGSSFLVSVVDTTPPRLTVPASLTVQDGSSVTWNASAFDLVDGSVDVLCTPASGSSFSSGTTLVQCSAADSRQNHAVASFNVTVQSAPPPPPPPRDDVTAEATGPDGAIVTYPGSGPDDADGRPTTSCTPASGTRFPLGTTSVRCADGSSFSVHVVDTTAPSLSVPPFVNVSDGSSVTWDATATDLVDGSVPVQCAPPSGSSFPEGKTLVQCTASDSRGNGAQASLEVTVETPPPPPRDDIHAEATSPGGAPVTFDGNCSPASGSLFPIGRTSVTCSDGSSFEVVVHDTTAPALTLPSSFTVQDGSSVTWTATASDLVDGEVPVQCTPSSGSAFAVGTTAVHCTATDSRDNRAEGTFDVTVQTPPAPEREDITAEATGPDGATVTYSASGSGGDDHNGRPATTCTPPSGSKFPLGTTRVTCADGSSFDVHVVDTTAPSISVPPFLRVSDGSSVTWEATATDLVDGSVSVTCTPPSGSGFPEGTTLVRCTAGDSRQNESEASFEVTVEKAPPPPRDDITAEATGPSGARVTFDGNCSPASGSVFPIATTRVSCADGSSFNVIVVDTTAPALTLPSSFSVQDGSSVTWTATASDLVDGAVPVQCTPPSGSAFAPGTTAVHCSATDSRQNRAEASFTVTVTEAPPPEDIDPPVFLSITATPNVLAPPNGKLVSVEITAEVSDEIDPAPLVRVFDVTSNEAVDDDWVIDGPLSLRLRAERTGAGAGRVYTVHVEAIDASGNRGLGSVTVMVPHDSSAPATIPPGRTRSVRH